MVVERLTVSVCGEERAALVLDYGSICARGEAAPSVGLTKTVHELMYKKTARKCKEAIGRSNKLSLSTVLVMI